MSDVNPNPVKQSDPSGGLATADESKGTEPTGLSDRMIDLIRQATQYEPPISMVARRVLYYVAVVLVIAWMIVVNISRRGVGIPAVVMGIVDTIPGIVTILVLILAIQSNHSAGTIK